MKIKVSEATNLQLNWLVAKIEHPAWTANMGPAGACFVSHYTTDPALAWPIIDREKISLIEQSHKRWSNGDTYFAAIGDVCDDEELCGSHGATGLIAAMRCYVASKLGHEVEVPEELT